MNRIIKRDITLVEIGQLRERETERGSVGVK